MDLNRLQYFVVLASSDSLHEASQILGLTPPALSKAMKILEEELELSLWVKDGRKNILTDEGRDLFKQAPLLLESVKNFKEALHARTSKKNAPLRIGTFEVFSTYFLNFLETPEWQDIPLELHELLPGEIEKYLVQGEIDVGISYMPIPHPELDFLKITSIEMGVFTLKNAFSKVEQPNIPFVIPVAPLQGVPTRIKGLDGWPEDAYRRTINYQVTLMESALELCRQGKVAGYFPAFIVDEHNRKMKPEYHLVRRRFPGAKTSCYTEAYVIKRKSSHENKTIKQLAKALRKVTVNKN